MTLEFLGVPWNSLMAINDLEVEIEVKEFGGPSSDFFRGLDKGKL